MSSEEPFEADVGRPVPQEALVVDLDGYEGPLDVLLALAREQKVDLKRISILQLAEQYLAFVAELRSVRLELADGGVARLPEEPAVAAGPAG
jgi:segregation and condensation protein A